MNSFVCLVPEPEPKLNYASGSSQNIRRLFAAPQHCLEVKQSINIWQENAKLTNLQ